MWYLFKCVLANNKCHIIDAKSPPLCNAFVTEHVFESFIWGSLVIKSSILRNLYQRTQVYLYIMYCTSIISS